MNLRVEKAYYLFHANLKSFFSSKTMNFKNDFLLIKSIKKTTQAFKTTIVKAKLLDLFISKKLNKEATFEGKISQIELQFII